MCEERVGRERGLRHRIRDECIFCGSFAEGLGGLSWYNSTIITVHIINISLFS